MYRSAEFLFPPGFGYCESTVLQALTGSNLIDACIKNRGRKKTAVTRQEIIKKFSAK